MRNILTVALFCLLLFAGGISGVLLPDREYSGNEKRMLTQFPEFSANELFSGRFGSRLETYLSDQFPARDGWVTISTLAERALGKKEQAGVYFADDGYLIEIWTDYDKKQFENNIAAVKHLADITAQNGVSLKVMPVSTAACVLDDKLPAYAPNSDQRAVIEAIKKAGLDVIDVTDALRAARNEYLFYKTDHHWTSLGAYYAYTEWMRSRGKTALPLSEWTRETLCNDFRGTTYMKTGDPFATYDTIEAYYRKPAHHVDYNNGYYVTDTIYERSFLNGSNQYGVFLNSNQSTTVVSGDGEGKLLIIKDSYANTFAQFVVDDFEETHLIDMRFFRGSVQKYIERNGITEILVLYNAPNFTADADLTRVDR